MVLGLDMRFLGGKRRKINGKLQKQQQSIRRFALNSAQGRVEPQRRLSTRRPDESVGPDIAN
jgi:hypothetical protein